MPQLELACPNCRSSLPDGPTPPATIVCTSCGETLQALPDGRLSVVISHHATLSAQLDETTGTTPPPPSSSPSHVYEFLSPPQRPDELGRLAGYRVLKELGRGGMGLVFQAEDERLERLIALKVMLPHIALDDQARLRFLREARAAARLEHDHVVAIYQVGEEHGVPFIAMPFLRGESLDDRLKRTGRIPVAEAARIGMQVAEGLAAAHDLGLVHRDVKPANIWLEAPRGRVKLLDFGLARITAGNDTQLTHSGTILGTPAYMAPEQARGVKSEPRTDLFSLGAVLYRMLTGDQPFHGSDLMSLLTSLAVDTPESPQVKAAEVPPELDALVMQLLAKLPNDRPASGHEVADRLRPLVAAATLSASNSLVSGSSSTPGGSQLSTSDPTVMLGAATQAALDAATSSPSIKPRTSTIPGWMIGAGLAAVGALLLMILVALNRNRQPVAVVDVPPGGSSMMVDSAPAVAANAGQAASSQPVSAGRNGALMFDGIDDYVALPFSYDGNTPITLECYVKLAGLSQGDQTLLSNTEQGGIKIDLLGKGFPVKPGHWTATSYCGHNEEQIDAAETESISKIRAVSDLPAAVGKKVHVAAIFEKRSLRLYVDGKLQKSTRRIEEFIPSPWKFSIGGNPDQVAGQTQPIIENCFHGQLDEIRFSRVARYADDFTPAARFKADVHTLALYHCDEASGSQLIDSSSHRHHGQIHGARWSE